MASGMIRGRVCYPCPFCLKDSLKRAASPCMNTSPLLSSPCSADIPTPTAPVLIPGQIVKTGAVGVGISAERSEEHTSELQSRGQLVCRILLEKKKADSGTGAAPASRLAGERPALAPHHLPHRGPDAEPVPHPARPARRTALPLAGRLLGHGPS